MTSQVLSLPTQDQKWIITLFQQALVSTYEQLSTLDPVLFTTELHVQYQSSEETYGDL
jgi:hypothetical protein